MQFDYLTQLTGGPQKYRGKSMIDAHKGRGIQDKEFGLVATHVLNSMKELGVPDDLVNEVMGALSGLKN